MYDYVVWDVRTEPNFSVLGPLNGLNNPIDLVKGISMQPWPGDVSFKMDSSFPKSVKLADNIRNLPNVIVVSLKLKEIIEQSLPPEIEYLPVKIYDHKDRIAFKDYFIVNPLMLEDCIDQAKSTIEWNPIDKNLISSCFDMVIDIQKINSQAVIFRLKYYPTKILLKRKLAEAIELETLTGIRFIEIEDIEY